MKPQAPTVEAVNSPTHETVEKHPAYAQIWASRISGHRFLYGSDFLHNGYIEITISASDLCRGLSNDRPYARQEYIQVALSEAQWATFVSTLNAGRGTQCTACHIQGKDVPEIAHAPNRKGQFSQEHSDHLKSAQDALKKIGAAIGEMNVSDKKKKELLSMLNGASMNIGSNLDFVAEQFGEHMEKVTEHAKIEANAYIQHVISRAGIKALGEPPVLMITEGEGGQ